MFPVSLLQTYKKVITITMIIMHVYDVAAVHTTVLFGVDEFRDCGAGQAATISSTHEFL
jgi:hypothetical protein